jgi:ubiquinone/menaquinone biosynthesis C-methylase UbiE
VSASPRRRLLLPEMEGGAARRYARQRGTEGQVAECRREAARLTAGLPDGARVLEVAPGPGYLSLEMARSGRLHVTGLDISHTMVEIATAKARDQGVAAEFRQGDVSEMPFAGQSFDLVVTQAAFKNFRRPLAALEEMHRVLREGGTAVVQDMSHEASRAEIAREVRGMEQRGVSALITRWILMWLRRRAYSPTAFQALVAKSPFGSCAIQTSGIGLEARLSKPGGSAPAADPGTATA